MLMLVLTTRDAVIQTATVKFTMIFKVGCKYMVRYTNEIWKVFYVRKKTGVYVVLRDGHSDYRRKVRVDDGGEYVILDGFHRLCSINRVNDPAKYPVGLSTSLMDQVWYPDMVL